MKRILAGVLVSLFPVVALAAQGDWVSNIFLMIGGWVKLAVPLIISLAVVWFLWNVFIFMSTADEEKKGRAKTGMIWGVVAIAVMVSIWGLVGVLSSIFNVGPGGAAQGVSIPTLQ